MACVFSNILEISCGNLANILHGSEDFSDGTLFLSVAVFSCESGYVLQGAQLSVCGADGTWSSEVPTCKGTYTHYITLHLSCVYIYINLSNHIYIYKCSAN